MPHAVRDGPLVETDSSAVNLSSAVAVGEPHSCLLPGPGGEIRAPLLCPLAVRAVRGAGVPIGAELVAVGVRRFGAVPDLALGDGDDALSHAQPGKPGRTRQREG